VRFLAYNASLVNTKLLNSHCDAGWSDVSIVNAVKQKKYPRPGVLSPGVDEANENSEKKSALVYKVPM